MNAIKSIKLAGNSKFNGIKALQVGYQIKSFASNFYKLSVWLSLSYPQMELPWCFPTLGILVLRERMCQVSVAQKRTISRLVF